MLDAEPVKLTKLGLISISDGCISVDGFGADNGSCRDVAVLAAAWAIGELQRELLKTIEKPGGGSMIVD